MTMKKYTIQHTAKNGQVQTGVFIRTSLAAALSCAARVFGAGSCKCIVESEPDMPEIGADNYIGFSSRLPKSYGLMEVRNPRLKYR